MIIFVINPLGIFASKTEGDAPIATHCDRPRTGPISAQFVQPESWQVHILRCCGGMESTEDETKSLRMDSLYSGRGARLEESGKALVFEAPNHYLSVT